MGYIKTIHKATCDYCGKPVELDPWEKGATFEDTVLANAFAGYFFSSAYCCELCIEEARQEVEKLDPSEKDSETFDAIREWLDDTNNRPILPR